MFSPRRLFKSFGAAFRGLARAFETEQNFRAQLVFGLVAVILAWYFPLRRIERLVVVFLAGQVLIMELLNTAFEYFADLLVPRLHHRVEEIKNIMAGAVLATSLVAFGIGLAVFWPYFMAWPK